MNCAAAHHGEAELPVRAAMDLSAWMRERFR
jgi:hypothetical protein